MTRPIDKTKRQRTYTDKIICGWNQLKFSSLDPLILKIQRARFSKQNQSEPLISVYIPTYNRPEMLLERSIPSVLKQDYSNFELLVIGDCCEEATAEVVQSFNDPRIKYYNLPRRERRYPPTAENHWLAGPVAAANTALRLVTGTWIARIDDDDIWLPNHLSTMLHFALAGDYEFVSAQIETKRNNIIERAPVYGALDAYYRRKTPSPNQYNPLIGGTQTWLYRSYLAIFKYNINCWRKAWNKVNDIDLSLRMYDAGVRFGFLDQVTALVMPRPNEQTIGIEAYLAREASMNEHFKFR